MRVPDPWEGPMPVQKLIAGSILLLVLAGCGRGGASADSRLDDVDRPVVATEPAASDEADTAAVTTDEPLVADPCALLPADQVEAVLGEPVTATASQPGPFQAGCEYTADGEGGVGVRVFSNDGSTDLGEDNGTWENHEGLYGPRREVDGLGLRAVRFGDGKILVALDSYDVDVTFAWGRTTPTEADLLTLSRVVVSNLE